MAPRHRPLRSPLRRAAVASAGVALAAMALVLFACASETKPPPGAEACLGPPPAELKPQGYGSIGLPAEEPDLHAWVVQEQSGLVALTTRPCKAKPPTRMLMVPADAQIVRFGHESSAASITAGQRLAVWFAGGSTGTARAILIERTAPWPPAGAH